MTTAMTTAITTPTAMTTARTSPTPTATATATNTSAWQDDGWTAAARIGVVVPHADVGPESELRAMAPAGIGVHAARVYFGAMRPGGVMDEKIPHAPVAAFTQGPILDETVELLAACPLDVVGCAFTSSAYKHGPDGEARLVERLAARSFGRPVTTTCTAAAAALHTLGARRLALVNPPWFDADLDAAGRRYFEQLGFEVAWHAPAGVPSDAPNIEPAALASWIADRAGAAGAVGDAAAGTAVLVGGNGLRAVGIIDALEARLGVPVLTANQVLLWHCLELAGARTPVAGYGRLLSDAAPAAPAPATPPAPAAQARP